MGRLLASIKPGTFLQCVCSWCNAKPVWRLSTRFSPKKYACDQHQQELIIFGKDLEVKYNAMDDHYSEADYQTWMRI
jgi:hypothetical protein